MQEVQKATHYLTELLSKQKGLLGRVDTWQGENRFENIGIDFSEDILPTIAKLNANDEKALGKIINYFVTHAEPLKIMLDAGDSQYLLSRLYINIAWSHFMTVLLFGILEIAVIGKSAATEIDSRGRLRHKQEAIRSFLNNHLTKEKKDDIAARYKLDPLFGGGKQIQKFDDVIDHLWDNIRSEFVHRGGIEYRPLDWYRIEGVGSRENPMQFQQDVPMQDLLLMAWQAILTAYGYPGVLSYTAMDSAK